MHNHRTALVLMTLTTACMLHGQPPTNAAQGPTPSSNAQPANSAAHASVPASNAAPTPPSTVLRPSIQTVLSTLESLKLDKWKKGSVRDEAGENVDAIMHDIQTNLPPLVSDADSAPASLTKSLPMMKHLDALYDVLLRVEEASRVSAPTDQITGLQQALKSLSDARLALDANLETQAAAQEKQIADLRAAYQAQQQAAARAAATPTPVCTPPPPPAKKKKKAPATNKATPQASSNSSQGQKPPQ